MAFTVYYDEISYIMYIFFILGYLNVVIQSEPSFVILKNSNGMEKSISSIVKIQNGRNISLTCKIINVQEKDNNYSLTYRSKYHDKFQSEVKNNIILNNITDPTTKLNLNDKGIYNCTSTKYNLQLLIVQSQKKKSLRSESRWKRAQYNYGKNLLEQSNTVLSKILGSSNYFNSTDLRIFTGHGYHWAVRTPEPDVLRINIPDHVKVMIDKARENIPQNTFNILPSGQDKNNYLWNGDQGSDSNKKNNYDIYYPLERSEKSYAVFYFLGVVGILLLIGGLCIISHNKNSSTRSREVSVNAIPLPPPCSRLNPPRINRITTRTQENINVLTSLITTPVNNNEQPNQLDAPPSYDHSIRIPIYHYQDTISNALIINNCDLPPSYDEALANNAIHSPNSDIRRDVAARPAPLASENDI